MKHFRDYILFEEGEMSSVGQTDPRVMEIMMSFGITRNDEDKQVSFCSFCKEELPFVVMPKDSGATLVNSITKQERDHIKTDKHIQNRMMVQLAGDKP